MRNDFAQRREWNFGGALDCEASEFEWIDCTDSERSVIAFIQWAKAYKDCFVIVWNIQTECGNTSVGYTCPSAHSADCGRVFRSD